MPARYVIARDGIVAYAEVNPDHTHRSEPSDLLPILDQLARSKFATGRSRPPNPSFKDLRLCPNTNSTYPRNSPVSAP